MPLSPQQLEEQALPDLEEALTALRSAARLVDRARKNPTLVRQTMPIALWNVATATDRIAKAMHYAVLAIEQQQEAVMSKPLTANE